MLTSPPPFSVSVSCLRNQKGQTRSFLRSLPELTFCDSETRDSSRAFKAFPVFALEQVWRVSLSGARRQRGDTKPNSEASMGTALTTSSGLEPIQGTLTGANCAHLWVNLPRKRRPGTLPSLVTSATDFNHRVDGPFMALGG